MALSALIRFQKPPFSCYQRRIKTFLSTPAFSHRFQHSTLDHENDKKTINYLFLSPGYARLFLIYTVQIIKVIYNSKQAIKVEI